MPSKRGPFIKYMLKYYLGIIDVLSLVFLHFIVLRILVPSVTAENLIEVPLSQIPIVKHGFLLVLLPDPLPTAAAKLIGGRSGRQIPQLHLIRYTYRSSLGVDFQWQRSSGFG